MRVPFAASEARRFSLQRTDATDFDSAARTAVMVSAFDLTTGQGKIVATLLARDAEVRAGLLPFRTVRRNAAASGAMMCEQMRQLVQQRALNVGGRKIDEMRIQRHERLRREGHPSCAAHSRIPPDFNARSERSALQLPQHRARTCLEVGRLASRLGLRRSAAPGRRRGERRGNAGGKFGEKIELHGTTVCAPYFRP